MWLNTILKSFCHLQLWNVVDNSLSSHAVALVLILIVLNLKICLTKESHHNIWHDWQSLVKRVLILKQWNTRELDTVTWGKLHSNSSVLCLALASATVIAQTTCSILTISFFSVIFVHVYFFNSNLQGRYTQKFWVRVTNKVFSAVPNILFRVRVPEVMLS